MQCTQGGTFFVTVPKSWAQQHGLRRGSVVSITETSDGRLLVDPEYEAVPPPRSIVLKPGPHLGREIVGKYLLGFDIIKVEAKRQVSFDLRDTVKKAASSLIGLEIVDEDYSGIILQCLLHPSGFPPQKILRRGYAIVTGMHRDVVRALIAGDLRLARNVIARDTEVNRLYFLLVRILRTVVQNQSLSGKLGISPIECLDYRLAASLVETIGDECVRVAAKVAELKGVKPAEDLRRLFADFSEACSKALEDALMAFLAGNVGLAEAAKQMRKRVERIFADIEKVTRAQSLDVVPQILAAASILRQIYEHTIDIADLVMPRKI